jgi:thiamine biosynthesis lipoprotein
VTLDVGIPAAVVRHAEHVMGTVFSFDIRPNGTAPEDVQDALDEAIQWLHWVDETFSTYKPDSQIRRLGRGELRLEDCHESVREVLELCADAYRATDGWFDVMHGGRLDPTGLVKGWSIDRASAILAAYGLRDHCINGGGDVFASGSPAPEEPWRVGVTDPHHVRQLLATVAIADQAVATSGTVERGAHIVNPFNGRAVSGVVAATVVGPDLTHADAYATATVAMGAGGLDWLDRLPGYEGLVVDAAGNVRHTKAFSA